MKGLSNKQRKVYDRLRSHQSRYGKLPDVSELAREMSLHYVSLKQHLQALAKKGYIIFESRGRGQSPIFQLPIEATGVPVLGSIPAGPVSLAEAHPEGYLPLHGSSFGGSFALRVSGSSMADLIQDGDVVLLREGKPHRSGEICAVRIEDNDATLKYLDFLDDSVVALRPHNPDYSNMRMPADEVQVDGVYQGLLRGLVLSALFEEEIPN